MPNKMMLRLLRGKGPRRRLGCDGKRQQRQQPDEPDEEPERSEQHQERGGLFSRLASRLTTKKSEGSSATGTPQHQQRRRGPHRPRSPLIESWPQPELLELRRSDASPKRPLLTPLRHRRLTAGSCRASSVAAVPARADASDATATELLVARVSDRMWRPDCCLQPSPPATSVITDDGDCDSFGDSCCVSDCVLRLRMTTTDSLSNNNYSNNYSHYRRRGHHARQQRQYLSNYHQHRSSGVVSNGSPGHCRPIRCEKFVRSV